jgi:hypothetical protein
MARGHGVANKRDRARPGALERTRPVSLPDSQPDASVVIGRHGHPSSAGRRSCRLRSSFTASTETASLVAFDREGPERSVLGAIEILECL